MSDSTNNYTLQILMSVFGGFVLLVSEILPFIKSVKSNGLLELIINTCIVKYQQHQTNEIDEEEPLLNDIGNEPIRIPIKEDTNILSDKMDSLNSSINNISYTINNYITETQNSKQLKLQSIELYELNYIINYIKVNYPKKMFPIRFLSKSNKQLLISQGYTIDYDSQNDTHTIKW